MPHWSSLPRRGWGFASTVALSAVAMALVCVARDVPPVSETFPPELVRWIPHPANPLFAGTGQDTWDQREGRRHDASQGCRAPDAGRSLRRLPHSTRSGPRGWAPAQARVSTERRPTKLDRHKPGGCLVSFTDAGGAAPPIRPAAAASSFGRLRALRLPQPRGRFPRRSDSRPRRRRARGVLGQRLMPGQGA